MINIEWNENAVRSFARLLAHELGLCDRPFHVPPSTRPEDIEWVERREQIRNEVREAFLSSPDSVNRAWLADRMREYNRPPVYGATGSPTGSTEAAPSTATQTRDSGLLERTDAET